jgi:hypothetical protein
MNEITIGIIGLGVLVAVFLTGFELGFSMALVGFVGYGLVISVRAGFGMVAQDLEAKYTDEMNELLKQGVLDAWYQRQSVDATLPDTARRLHLADIPA